MTALTMHQLVPRMSRLKAYKTKDETVPKIGTEIDINLDLVVFEDAEGRPKTPMTKARYDPIKKRWLQVPVRMAGLLLFFQNPPSDHHTKAFIRSVIPSGMACYVEPR